MIIIVRGIRRWCPLRFLISLGTNQILSVAMSIFTLSHTAATYLFYQHEEYTSFDKKLQKWFIGLNNPPLISTIICTMLYIYVTAPRIWSNALTLSISPILSLVMFMVEFIDLVVVLLRLYPRIKLFSIWYLLSI